MKILNYAFAIEPSQKTMKSVSLSLSFFLCLFLSVFICLSAIGQLNAWKFLLFFDKTIWSSLYESYNRKIVCVCVCAMCNVQHTVQLKRESFIFYWILDIKIKYYNACVVLILLLRNVMKIRVVNSAKYHLHEIPS